MSIYYPILDKQFWSPILNPTLVNCHNASCDGKLIWDDADGTPFVYSDFLTGEVIITEPFECLRYYEGPSYLDDTVDATGNFDDIGCDKKFHFICEQRCYP